MFLRGWTRKVTTSSIQMFHPHVTTLLPDDPEVSSLQRTYLSSSVFNRGGFGVKAPPSECLRTLEGLPHLLPQDRVQ